MRPRVGAWTLRAPPDCAERHPERCRRREAVDLGRVLAESLRARGLAGEHAALLERLEAP